MKIKIYGCRGSTPRSRPGSRYGGDTSCMTAESGGDYVIIDAGSGLTTLQEEQRARFKNTPANILISHLHLDHIIGLGTFEPVWNKMAGVRIFTCSRNDKPLIEQVYGPFTPPYWPVSMIYTKNTEFIPIEANVPFTIGCFTITPFLANHPDKTLSFHLTDGRKNFVHLLDSEAVTMNEDEREVLFKYCQDADLVVFDSAYSNEDYNSHRGWGHSTVKCGVDLAREWNCKRMLFSHLGFKYSDGDLDGWVKDFGSGEFIIARDGMEFEI